MMISQNLPRVKAALAGGAGAWLALHPGPARAHASEQGFVLLLPTDIYITSGAASVAATVLLLALLPERLLAWLFAPFRLPSGGGRARWVRHGPLLTSTLACVALALLVWTGQTGPRDPLANPLPLTVWTVWWVALVSLQGLFGDHWRWTNPWSGPAALLRAALGLRPVLRLPRRLGRWPAIAGFLGFAAVLMADPAPSDPARLASYVGLYWLAAFTGLMLFGPRWLVQAEALTVLMRAYAQVALFGRHRGGVALGLPGWQALARAAPAPSLAVFMVLMLGSGSFDGLNETFWWLAILGVNPLEFPGRSAVVTQNVIGLLSANAALLTAYALAVWAGVWLVRGGLGRRRAFALFAPTILPIALGYHVAHYLPTFLVDSQYALLAATDPLARGDDFLDLGTYYVTTGFFNAADSVRRIFLTQAGAVVAGHIVAVMMAHAIATRQFGSSRRAALSQAPLALFMIAYTLFGLWLLAAPRGA